MKASLNPQQKKNISCHTQHAFQGLDVLVVEQATILCSIPPGQTNPITHHKKENSVLKVSVSHSMNCHRIVVESKQTSLIFTLVQLFI